MDSTITVSDTITDNQGVSFMDKVTINVYYQDQVFNTFASGSPVDIERTSDGNYLVLDSGACTVTEYDPDGTPTGFSLGSCGSENGQFDNPMGLAVGPTGSIYVADTGNNRIQKFNAQGEFIYIFSNWTCGPSTGPFNEPTGIAVDKDNRVFVVERAGERMVSFTYDFAQCDIGTPSGFFDTPRGVEVDDSGYIYIVGNGLHFQNKGTINIFSSSGQYLYSVNTDSGLPLVAPNDIMHRNGHLYIADSGKVLILNDDFNALQIEQQATAAVSAPLALAPSSRSEAITFMAVDAGEVKEVELPIDTPEAVWDAMKTALIAADFQGALDYIWINSRHRYEKTFTLDRVIEHMPTVAASWGPLTKVSISKDRATYSFQHEATIDGQTQVVTQIASFARDLTGRWMVEGF